MSTGDGLLARIALIDRISTGQLSQLCVLASRHGNGIIDISSRGNLQIRGLSDASARLLDQDVRALGLPVREDLAVEHPPLAGLDATEIADPRELAAAIREGCRGIEGLAPKMSVVVDGGGQVRLSNLLADIRLVANPHEEGGGWTIMLGGTEVSGRIHATMSGGDAVAEVSRLLKMLAAIGPDARGRDLAGALPDSTVSTEATPPFGIRPLVDGRSAVGIGLPFGQIAAERLRELCAKANDLHIDLVQPTIERSVLFLGKSQSCKALLDFAEQREFVVAPLDPRGAIAVCSGSPACASAAIPTHSLAAGVLAEFADLLDGSFKLHVTGCPKGCAHPQPSPLALCGTATGISFISGRAADRPFLTISRTETQSALRQLATFLKREKREGESSAACLSRLGPTALAANTMSGRL